MPAAMSRCCIQSGDAPFATPPNQRAAKRGLSSGSSMRTETWLAASSPDSATVASGRRSSPPVKAAISRASPTMLSASPRFGLTSTSSTMSPTTSASGVPSAISSPWPRMWMPSASVPRPSSMALHSIPLLTSPRILLRSMRRSPGSTAPTSAAGTSWPTSRFCAPHTIASSPAAPRRRRPASATACPRSGGVSPRGRAPPPRPSNRHPAVSTALTSIPRIVSSSARARGVRSKLT